MNKYTLYMETTKKEPEETISEIQKLLKNFHVKHVIMQYTPEGNIEAVSFSLSINGTITPYLLPARHEPLWEFAKKGKTKYIRTEDQARRVAWRQVYRWIEAQLAMVEINMVNLDEIFLPYMMVDENTTIYNLLKDKGIGLLTSRIKNG